MILANYNDVKLLPREDLEDIVPSGFKFKTKPWKHQLACFLASIINENGFLNNLDLGAGKTKVIIDIVRYFEWKYNRKLKVLVVCLNNAVENWQEEVYKHSHGINATCLRGSAKNRWKKINGNGFFIVNFEGLMRMMTKKVQVKGKNRKKHVIDNAMMAQIKAMGFDALAYDESHKLQTVTSLNFKIAQRLTRIIQRSYCLTGTLFGNSLLAIWPQYYVIDLGETYGTSFYRDFRNMHFVDKGFFGPDYRPTKKGEKAIKDRMWRKAIRYNEDEIDDLPDKVYRVLKYDLSRTQRADYTRLMDKLNYDGPVQNKHMAFRQICSGFILREDRLHRVNPKLDLLEEVIESAVDHSKIVIFHEFIKEGELIAARVKKMKLDYCELNGRVSDKHSQIKAFENNPKKKVMIAHPLSGGSSINLVSAAYCAFFSNGGSVINRKQCEKRIHRGGQNAPRVYYYDFVGNKTIETKMINNLNGGIDALDGIVDGKSLRKALMGDI
jgi:SNF2 family DNA or RNA helicase